MSTTPVSMAFLVCSAGLWLQIRASLDLEGQREAVNIEVGAKSRKDGEVAVYKSGP